MSDGISRRNRWAQRAPSEEAAHVRLRMGVVAVLAVVLSFVPGQARAEAKGDVNTDEVVDFRDVVAAMPLLKSNPPQDEPTADVAPVSYPESGDGQIRVDDILMLLGGVTQEDYGGDGLSLDAENQASEAALWAHASRYSVRRWAGCGVRFSWSGVPSFGGGRKVRGGYRC